MKAWITASILLAATLCTTPATALADAPVSAETVPVPAAALGMESFRLWPGRAPEASSDSAADLPTVTLFRPQPGTANGTAVIVAPGGLI